MFTEACKTCIPDTKYKTCKADCKVAEQWKKFQKKLKKLLDNAKN